MKVIRRLDMDDLLNAPEEAKRIEALGYDGLAAHEFGHDTLLRLTVAATATERIGIESRLAIAFPRSPMVMAECAWDLQLYSRGRFKLGIGTQVKAHNVRRFSIPWSAPGPRFRDYALALHAIWDSWQDGTPLDYHSDHYTFTLMPPAFSPGPIPYPRPQVYMGGVNPYNLKLAGAIADGAVVLTMNSPEYIRTVVCPYVAEGAKSAGRDPKSVKISGGGFVITGARKEDLKQGMERVRLDIAFHSSTRTYQRVLEAHGWEELIPRLHALSLEQKWDEMARQVSDEMVHTFAAVGLYDEVAPLLKQRFDGLLDEISPDLYANPPMDDVQERRFLEELRA